MSRSMGPQERPVQRWEYHCVYIKLGPDQPTVPEMLEAMGDDGWELAAAAGLGEHSMTLFFKRPKPERIPDIPRIQPRRESATRRRS
jgi:hypothetical protein